MLPLTWCNSLGCKWDDDRRDVGGNRHGRRKIVLVSVMLMMPDITVPLGISREHYAVSILAYLHPVYKLLDPIITAISRVCVCLCVCGGVCILTQKQQVC